MKTYIANEIFREAYYYLKEGSISLSNDFIEKFLKGKPREYTYFFDHNKYKGDIISLEMSK